MAKIFIFGERLVESNLGYLSVDGGKEIKIKANGSNMTTYECEIPVGTHTIQFCTSGKIKRGLAQSDGSVLGGLGAAMNSSQIGFFEDEVTFGEDDVLILKVVETVTSTNVKYLMSNESEYMGIFKDETNKPEKSGLSGCCLIYLLCGVAFAVIFIICLLLGVVKI